jgi:hypothetical protein
MRIFRYRLNPETFQYILVGITPVLLNTTRRHYPEDLDLSSFNVKNLD